MPVTNEDASAVAQSMVRMTKLVAHLRQQTPRLHPQVEPSAFPLMLLLGDGPRRVSTVAGLLYADISTVSRQATALTAAGMVEKQPDPSDRRAAVLALTDAGRELLRRFREQRATWFADILQGWEPEQARRFRLQMDRFSDSCEARLDQLLAAPGADHPTTMLTGPDPAG